MKTRRLDSSHLTPQERKEAVKLTAVGISIMMVGGVLLGFTGHIFYATLLAGGSGIVGFMWGRVGTLEDERSGD
jgi:hypothetical protein